MVNTELDTSAELKILTAAKKVFLQHGMAGARMQDIADAAGINKALLHYYFRSKEKLFDVIFQDAADRIFPIIHDVLSADLPLFDKIEKFCVEYISIVMENPHIPLFVIHEIQKDPEIFMKKIMAGKVRPNPRKFLEQVREAVAKGTVREIDPMQLFMHLVSLTIFPFVARPMLQRMAGLSDMEYRKLLEHRKQEVPRFLIQFLKS